MSHKAPGRSIYAKNIMRACRRIGSASQEHNVIHFMRMAQRPMRLAIAIVSSNVSCHVTPLASNDNKAMTSSDRRVVYTTGIGRVPVCSRCGEAKDACRCASEARRRESSSVISAPQDGYVRIARDRKSRGGKTVTVLAGIPGDATQVSELAQVLKKLCGSGGTVKGDSIEIQGDHRDRLEGKLKELGYKVKRVGG